MLNKFILVSSLTIIVYFLRNFSDLENGCLICMPEDASKIFRPPVDCSICSDVFEIEKVRNISPWYFYDHYYSQSKPVIITDGMVDWKATEHFTFEFFKNLYLSNEEYFENEFDCQFFPYQTEFKSLFEALKMDTNRSHLVEGTKPWYIGWSNCIIEIGNELRKYYKTPYFIPPISESIGLSWSFMGGPGYGAQMHVDNVQYPSWQAQLRGRKMWKLAPPPECHFVCREIEAVLEPNEINTNQWYHQTTVLPGDISITIGEEFD